MTSKHPTNGSDGNSTKTKKHKPSDDATTPQVGFRLPDFVRPIANQQPDPFAPNALAIFQQLNGGSLCYKLNKVFEAAAKRRMEKRWEELEGELRNSADAGHHRHIFTADVDESDLQPMKDYFAERLRREELVFSFQQTSQHGERLVIEVSGWAIRH